jgi:CBS domain-containing protein
LAQQALAVSGESEMRYPAACRVENPRYARAAEPTAVPKFHAGRELAQVARGGARQVLIENWMTRRVRSVKPLDSIEHARQLMEDHRINQLPVVVDGRLVGIITDRNLRDAYPSVFESSERRHQVRAADPSKITVDMVMTADVMTFGPKDSLVDAARLMRRERIGAIPIVEGGRLVGVLTRSDVLEAFMAMAEPHKPPPGEPSR